jgi:glutamate carboxypeptidase
VTEGQLDSRRSAARLRQLVETESPTGHPAGIRACFDLIDEWTRLAMGGPGQRRIVDGVEHLYWPAREPGGVLLLGHVDTVWPLGTLDDWAYTERDGRVSGPGVFDMKSGLIAALDALELLGDTGQVALLVTSDEEKGSLTSRALLEDAARASRAVLLMEPSLDGALKVERRGGSMYRIDFDGVAAHAGLEPELGANALIEASRQVLAVGGIADDANGTTVTPTVMKAGSTVNTVPASAELHIDVRARSVAELERVDRKLRALDTTDPKVTRTVHGGINRPPLEARSSRGLFALAQEVAAELGLPPLRKASVGGASDGNFTGALGIPTLDGLGPLGAGAHARGEWVDLASMSERALLIAGLVRRITQTRDFA